MLVRFVGRDHPRPWNKGLLVGQKKPLQPKHVWSIRVRLEIARMWRDLALFNLAIDSKLRACDLVKLRIDEVSSGAMVQDRATVVQKKRADRCSSRLRSRRGFPRSLVTNSPRDWFSIFLTEPTSCTPSPIHLTIFPAGASLG